MQSRNGKRHRHVAQSDIELFCQEVSSQCVVAACIPHTDCDIFKAFSKYGNPTETLTAFTFAASYVRRLSCCTNLYLASHAALLLRMSPGYVRFVMPSSKRGMVSETAAIVYCTCLSLAMKLVSNEQLALGYMLEQLRIDTASVDIMGLERQVCGALEWRLGPRLCP